MKKFFILSSEKYEQLRSAAATCQPPSSEVETKNQVKEQMKEVLHDEAKADSEKWSLYSAYLKHLLNKPEIEVQGTVRKVEKRPRKKKKVISKRSPYILRRGRTKKINTDPLKWMVE